MDAREQQDWDAAQYVLGELNSAQTQRWEKQLDQDQQARDAVVDAVELLQCIRMVDAARGGREDETALLRTASANSNDVCAASVRFASAINWATAVGGGMVALLMLATVVLPSPTRTSRQGPSELPPSDQQLAIIWGENHESSDDPLWPSEQLEFAANDRPAAEADLELVAPDSSATSWISVAVQGLVQEANQGEGSNGEEL